MSREILEAGNEVVHPAEAIAEKLFPGRNFKVTKPDIKHDGYNALYDSKNYDHHKTNEMTGEYNVYLEDEYENAITIAISKPYKVSDRYAGPNFDYPEEEGVIDV